MTALFATTPLLPHLWLVWLFALIFGVGSSINVSAYIVWTIELWHDKSGPVLQLNALGFGLGSIITSASMSPYLTGENEHGQPLLPSEDIRDKLKWPSIILCGSLAIG